MRKIIITENEAKRILGLHYKEKNIKKSLNEQVTALQKELEQYINTGCIKDGQIVSITTSNPKKEFAIKKQSKKNPDRINYFFTDFTSGYFDESGKFKYNQGKWKCSSTLDWTTREEIDKLKKEQNWLERNETGVSDYDLSNTDKWETKEVGNVTLYRKKSQITATGDLGDDAKQILTSLENSGFYTADKVSAELRIKPTMLSILYPNWKQYFSDDLPLYYDEKIQKVDPTKITQGDTVLQSIEENLTIPLCRSLIDKMYQYHRYQISIPKEEILAIKNNVQACVNKYKFDNPLYKTPRKIRILAGISDDKDVGVSKNSPYRISLPNNYF